MLVGLCSPRELQGGSEAQEKPQHQLRLPWDSSSVGSSVVFTSAVP